MAYAQLKAGFMWIDDVEDNMTYFTVGNYPVDHPAVQDFKTNIITINNDQDQIGRLSAVFGSTPDGYGLSKIAKAEVIVVDKTVIYAKNASYYKKAGADDEGES